MGVTSSLLALILPAILVGVLTFISFIPLFGFGEAAPHGNWSGVALMGVGVVFLALATVSVALLAASMKHLSIYYQEPKIFSNERNAAITLAIPIISLAITMFFSFSDAWEDSYAFSGFITLIVGLITVVVAAFFIRRSFSRLAEKSGVLDFSTAGVLYLVGACTVIFGAGIVVLWVGMLYSAMTFNKLKSVSNLTARTSYTNVTPLPPSPAAFPKRCPNCGAKNSVYNLYCTNCGRPLQ